MMNYNQRYSDLKASKKALEKSIENKALSIETISKEKENFEKARWVFSEVQRITQQNVKGRIESLVTLAIRSVFDRNFKFELEFERKRNKLECTPYIMEGKNRFDPEYDKGGGIIDLISFAFRVVLWSLENPRSRSVFILDEPMKMIGKGLLLQRAGQMFKEISEKLKFQLIIVTHERMLADFADRVFEISHDGKESYVEVIGVEIPKLVKKKKRVKRIEL